MIAMVGASGNIDNVDLFVQQLVAFSNTEHLTVQAFDATMIYSKDQRRHRMLICRALGQ